MPLRELTCVLKMKTLEHGGLLSLTSTHNKAETQLLIALDLDDLMAWYRETKNSRNY